MSAISKLFEPLQLGSLTVRNRIFMSALTRSRSVPNNVPNGINLEYYQQRAGGGAGVIVTEGCLVSQQGTEWPNAPGIWNKEQVAGWKKIVDAVHAEGAKIFVQLWHTGRVSHPDMPEQIAAGVPVYAPSAIAAKGGKFRHLPGAPSYVTPTEIGNPQDLLGIWKNAAINAKEAGFDGVEVHGANGYLLHQFLDSNSNARTDSYGGSVENRIRFPLEVVKTVTEVFGADRVGIKLSPAGGYNDMGMPLDETLSTFSTFIKELNALDLAYICLMRYNAMMDPTKRATIHDVLAAYSPLITAPTRNIPNSGFTPEEAAGLVAEGKIDGAEFGFAWITHPDFAKRVEHGKPLDGQPDFMTLYGTGGAEEEQAKGYTDYPVAVY